MEMLQEWTGQAAPFLIMGAIGLLVGVERERRLQSGVQSIGVRTFTLLGLLGALAGAFQGGVALAITLVVGILLGLSYYLTSATQIKKQEIHLGMTTELAACMVFSLGFLVYENPLLTAALGVTVFITLLSKEKLHQFSKDQLKPQEVQAIAILVVLLFVILPFLPKEYLDPWHLIQVRSLVMILILLGLMQFAGYAAIRLLGARLGLFLTGFFSGFASSTAAHVTLPKMVRKTPELALDAAKAAIFSTLASWLKLWVILWVTAPQLSKGVALSLLPAVCFCMALGLFKKNQPLHLETEQEGIAPSPLELKSALQFAVILTVLLGVMRGVGQQLGDDALLMTSFITGLGELHGAGLAIATLFEESKIGYPTAFYALCLSIIASLLSKILISFMIPTKKYTFYVCGFNLLVLLVFLITLLVRFLLQA